jgi:hypothetical protein
MSKVILLMALTSLRMVLMPLSAARVAMLTAQQLQLQLKQCDKAVAANW